MEYDTVVDNAERPHGDSVLAVQGTAQTKQAQFRKRSAYGGVTAYSATSAGGFYAEDHIALCRAL